MTPRLPVWRRAIDSSSRSSSSGSMRTFESEPMHMPISRWQTRATGRKPSPRFASVVGQAQIREPASLQQVELVAVGMRRVHDRRARAEAAGAVRAARSGARRARRGTPRSREVARRRARAAAARARPRSARARASASAGHARTEWGATPTRMPVSAQLLELAQVLGDGVLAEARDAAAQVTGVEADEARCPPPRPRRLPPAPRRGRGSGTRRPPCSRSPAARGTPRRIRDGSRRPSASSARAIISSRHAQKSPPRLAPRRARWNAWQCASTKPGIASVGTPVSSQSWPLAPFRRRWRRSRMP